MRKGPIPILTLEWGVAGILTVVAALLHLTRVTMAGPLWRDEVAALNVATQPSLTGLWHCLSFEIMPVFPPLLIRLWAGTFSASSDFSLRIFGCGVGLSLLGALWWIARCTGHKIPLVSLLLLGLSGLVVRWGDSLRGHGMGLVFLLISYGSIWRMVESPKPALAMAAVLASVLSVQCSYQNAPLLGAICGAAIFVAARRRRWTRVAWVVVTGAIAAASLLPYVGVLRRSDEWTMLIRTGVTFSALGTSLAQSFAVTQVLVVWAALLLGAVGVGILRVAVPSGSDESADRFWYAGLTLAGAILGFVVYVKWAGYLSAWHFLPVLGLAAVSMDTLLGGMAIFPSLHRGRLVVIIMAGGVLALPAWQEVQVRATNVDRAAESLTAKAKPDDLIVINPWNIAITFQRYYHGPVQWASVPAMTGIGIHRYDLLKREMMTPAPIEPMLERIEKTLKQGNQVWLVGHVYLLREGAVPKVLKPAPQEGFWSDAIYTTGWSFEEGYFLRRHASVADRVEAPSPQRVSPEDVSLLRMSGWKD